MVLYVNALQTGVSRHVQKQIYMIVQSCKFVFVHVRVHSVVVKLTAAKVGDLVEIVARNVNVPHPLPSPK